MSTTETGRRAKGMTRAGIGIWLTRLSACGLRIVIRRINGFAVGMIFTLGRVLKEMSSISGKKEIKAPMGSGKND